MSATSSDRTSSCSENGTKTTNSFVFITWMNTLHSDFAFHLVWTHMYLHHSYTTVNESQIVNGDVGYTAPEWLQKELTASGAQMGHCTPISVVKTMKWANEAETTSSVLVIHFYESPLCCQINCWVFLFVFPKGFVVFIQRINSFCSTFMARAL